MSLTPLDVVAERCRCRAYACLAKMPTEPGQQVHAWEDSKENFQPVRDGRKPGALLDSKAREERPVLQPKGIEADRARFIEAIEDYVGDDPLEKWLDYIRWTKETFSSTGKTSELLPLLEKVTREFHESDKYRDDLRYLKVWIMYADNLPDPSDVFSYLMDHNIGQGHALFFMAYATFCELTRNYALADSTYQKGIQAKAEPLDRLEIKFSEFQHRMVRRIQRKAEQTQQAQQQAQAGQVGGGSQANERRGLKTIRGPLGPRPVDKRRNTTTNSGSNSIPVFEDAQFSSSTVQPLPRGRMVLPAGHAESQKENLQAAVPWMGQTIKQKSSCVSSQPKETLAVMEDPEFAASAVGNSGDEDDAGQTKGSKASLRQRFDRDGIEEQLSSDPLMLMKNPPPKPAAKIETKVEAAAAAKLTVKTEELAVDVKLDAHPEDESKMPSPFDHDVTMATSDAYKAMNCLFTGDAKDAADDEGAPGALGAIGESSAAGARDLEPTMTINTRHALNTVNNMFKASFSVVEDKDETVCVSDNDYAVVSEDVGGMLIREDTVFLRGAAEHEKAVLKDDEATGAFSIREDTIFIGSGNVGEDTDAFSIREDTVFIGSGAASIASDEANTGTFSVREDTVFIPSNPASNLSLGIPVDTGIEAGNETENDENAVPEGLVQVLRRRDRLVNAPLSPLGLIPDDDAGFNPVKVEQDDDAEAALASAAVRSGNDAVADEGFAVFEDAIPDQRLINPFDSSFQGELVASLNPPVSKWPGVVELTDEEAAACEATFKVAKKNSMASKTSKKTKVPPISEELAIRDMLRATITGQIGEGAYATVYGATCDGLKIALKVEYPPCPWEFLLCKIIEGRSGRDACRTVNPTKMLLHDDFSVLVMPRGSGTLQELLNKYLAAKTPVGVYVTAAISLSLFRAMKQLHENKVVHNDIKPDNILYSISDVSDSLEDAISLSLIDVGRGVDLELLPEHAVLFGDSETESFRCIEMRERVPWIWQADTYAVAGVVHCIIHGGYMEVERATMEDTGETFVRCRSKLPRSYEAEVWEDIVFKKLLNVDGMSADCPPDWDALCLAMQNVLEVNASSSRKELENLRLFMSQAV